MGKLYNIQKQTKIRRKLRNSMTEEEIILWSKLKGKQFLGYKFRRQYGIGNYIVDFYCPKKRLIIEIDGGQHAELDRASNDLKRDLFFESLGMKVFRIWNNELRENLEGILEKLWQVAEDI